MAFQVNALGDPRNRNTLIFRVDHVLDRLFDSLQERICRLALRLIVEESVLYIRGPVQRRFGRLQLHDRFSLFH